jgi:hypothetical protein
MKERPILFSGPMVRAISEGRKTQTRRVIKPQPDDTHEGKPYWHVGGFRTSWIGRESKEPHWGNNWLKCPYGNPGDRLWVRETWRNYPYAGNDGAAGLVYRATNDCLPKGQWKPSIHMPRWASRITLEIKRVWVERLQEISEADCVKEGFDYQGRHKNPWYEFQDTWQSINGPDAWSLNPWVWVIEFARVK